MPTLHQVGIERAVSEEAWLDLVVSRTPYSPLGAGGERLEKCAALVVVGFVRDVISAWRDHEPDSDGPGRA